jgi:hypothetical protein
MPFKARGYTLSVDRTSLNKLMMIIKATNPFTASAR